MRAGRFFGGLISLLREELAELEEMVKAIEQAPDSIESGFLSSITREIERSCTLAASAERIAASIGRGALVILAGLVVILRILGQGLDVTAVVVASLAGAGVLAGLIYLETSRDRIQKMIAKARAEIGCASRGLTPRYR